MEDGVVFLRIFDGIHFSAPLFSISLKSSHSSETHLLVLYLLHLCVHESKWIYGFNLFTAFGVLVSNRSRMLFLRVGLGFRLDWQSPASSRTESSFSCDFTCGAPGRITSDSQSIKGKFKSPAKRMLLLLLFTLDSDDSSCSSGSSLPSGDL